jgi:hypothetical protein
MTACMAGCVNALHGPCADAVPGTIETPATVSIAMMADCSFETLMSLSLVVVLLSGSNHRL